MIIPQALCKHTYGSSQKRVLVLNNTLIASIKTLTPSVKSNSSTQTLWFYIYIYLVLGFKMSETNIENNTVTPSLRVYTTSHSSIAHSQDRKAMPRSFGSTSSPQLSGTPRRTSCWSLRRSKRQDMTIRSPLENNKILQQNTKKT